MKSAVLALSLILSNMAMASTMECLPFSKLGPASEIVQKAYFDKDRNTLTLILNNGKSISDTLTDASQVGKGALGFSEEITYLTGLNATVMPSAGKIYLVVSPFMSMSLPQQLLCK